MPDIVGVEDSISKYGGLFVAGKFAIFFLTGLGYLTCVRGGKKRAFQATFSKTREENQWYSISGEGEEEEEEEEKESLYTAIFGESSRRTEEKEQGGVR